MSVVGCVGEVYADVESGSCLCGEYGMIAGQFGSREGMFFITVVPRIVGLELEVSGSGGVGVCGLTGGEG